MTIRVAHKIPILIFFPGQNYPFCFYTLSLLLLVDIISEIYHVKVILG